MIAESSPYCVASFSGGKDSTAMLLHLIELGEHIDEVINIDTGMEFPDMYTHIEKIKKIVESNDIKFTTLHPTNTFEWYMIEKPVNSKKWGEYYGYGWPGPHMRWCTKHLKTDLMEKYLKEIRKEHGTILQYIGLAADEGQRLERKNNKKPNHVHPLVNWGWREIDCLNYCYSKGYDWNGLYRHLKRVSCYCCPLASLSDMRAIWKYYPELWSNLKDLENKMYDGRPHCKNPFTVRHTLDEITSRFEREALAEKQQTTIDNFIEI